MALRDSGAPAAHQVVDVHFADFMRDQVRPYQQRYDVPDEPLR